MLYIQFKGLPVQKYNFFLIIILDWKGYSFGCSLRVIFGVWGKLWSILRFRDGGMNKHRGLAGTWS